jgi:hypothetical protein
MEGFHRLLWVFDTGYHTATEGTDLSELEEA